MRWVWILSIALLPAPGWGLTVDEAVARALARHPATAAAQHGVAAAEARADRVGSAWLPRVSAVGQAVIRGPIPTLTIDTGLTPPGASAPLAIEREIGQRYTASGTLEVAWRALDFGERAAMADAAEAGVAASRADAAARAVELGWAVRQSYAAAAFFQDVVRVSVQAAQTAQKDVADAQARVAAGLGAPVDVAAAQSRLAERQAQLADGQAGVAQAHATLRLLLGLPADAPLTLDDGLEALAAAAPGTPGAAPDALKARAGAAAKAAEAQAVDRSFWPTLDLMGSAGVADPRTFVETEPGFTWQAGARLTWPLFDGDQRRRHLRQLEAEAQALRAAADAADEGAARARAEADTRTAAAQAQLHTAQARVDAAQTWLTAAQAARDAGAATALDLERARDRLDGARVAVARARFDAARAQADRLKADGISQRVEK
ncbi:MAG: TolC family protein [Myxococcales bacterium]|nr:TolC family protein [Myxococcales bacterium]